MKSVLEVDKDVKTRGAETLAYTLSQSYVVGLLVTLATPAIIFLLADRSALLFLCHTWVPFTLTKPTRGDLRALVVGSRAVGL